MTNPSLDHAILTVLSRVEGGLRQPTLAAETDIAIDRPITTNDFIDALGSLETRALIDSWTNLMGEKVWGITSTGRDALKGL